MSRNLLSFCCETVLDQIIIIFFESIQVDTFFLKKIKLNNTTKNHAFRVCWEAVGVKGLL